MKYERINEEYNAFITLTNIKTSNGKLSGIDFSVKDNICVKRVRTTAGSRILENYKPVFDATIIKRIKKEGGRIIGKTCMDEFGFGTFGTNCAYKQPKNPINKKLVPGGSSSGAGIVAKLADSHVAIAESTGGSISCPAAFCNVYGLTPTYGAISRYGLICYTNSMDKIGLMSKDLGLIKKTWDVIKGKDEKDSTSLDIIRTDPEVKRIGLVTDYFNHSEKGISNSVRDYANGLGIECEPVELKLVHEALSAYYILALSEASTNLAKYCGLRYGMQEEFDDKTNYEDYFRKIRSKYFGEEAKRRIILGTFARTKGYRDKYYLQAAKVRTLVIQEFKKKFEEYDLLLAPTMPCSPPSFEKAKTLTPSQVYALDLLTCAPNLCGFPTLNIPLQDKPVGIHLIANHFNENKLFEVGSWQK